MLNETAVRAFLWMVATPPCNIIDWFTWNSRELWQSLLLETERMFFVVLTWILETNTQWFVTCRFYSCYVTAFFGLLSQIQSTRQLCRDRTKPQCWLPENLHFNIALTLLCLSDCPEGGNCSQWLACDNYEKENLGDHMTTLSLT